MLEWLDEFANFVHDGSCGIELFSHIRWLVLYPGVTGPSVAVDTVKVTDFQPEAGWSSTSVNPGPL